MPGTKSGHALGHPISAVLFIILPLIFLLTGCGPRYSPNIYSGAAVQQANKVDKGVIVGVRKVIISADATVGTATGAAAGGIAGSQTADGAGGALATLGASLTGGLIGNVVGHKATDTFGYEYVVQKSNGDLVSVTQKDDLPLRVGQHVLMIGGAQARIVSDYTVQDKVDAPRPPATAPLMPPKPDLPKPNAPKPVSAPSASLPDVGQQPAAAGRNSGSAGETKTQAQNGKAETTPTTAPASAAP